MTPEQIDLLEHAAAILDGNALSLRMSHTESADGVTWGTDPTDVEAKRIHDDEKATCDKLYALADQMKAQQQTFQARVEPWLMACFGEEIADDFRERNHRFFEEATELVQACGMTSSEAHQLVDYTFGRPVGEKAQEAGGVMVTLAALCRAQRIDMHQCGEIELARIWTMVEKIRAKQAAKPKHSPLPEAQS